MPDYGRVTAYRSPAGYGIRLDAGTAYSGAIITRFYDSLLVKVTAWSPTAEETIARMHRALWEFRIRGVVTNLRFLDQLIMHPQFVRGDYTTKFIDQTPELFRIPRKRDRATRLLSFIGDVIVNGNPEVSKRDAKPKAPVFPRVAAPGAAGVAAGGLQAEARRARSGALRAMDARGKARAPDRYQHARCAPVAPGDALPNARHGGDRAALRGAPAAAVLGRVLGRRDVRRGAAIPEGGPLGAARRFPRGHAEPPAAGAAPLGERRGVRELSRQRGALFHRSRRPRAASTCSGYSTA